MFASGGCAHLSSAALSSGSHPGGPFQHGLHAIHEALVGVIAALASQTVSMPDGAADAQAQAKAAKEATEQRRRRRGGDGRATEKR